MSETTQTLRACEYDFESKDTGADGRPLCFGRLHDLRPVLSAGDDSADPASLQSDLIAAALRARRAKGAFPAPYLLMDICDAADMALDVKSDTGDGVGPGPELRGMLCVLVPAAFVVDLGPISNDSVGGMSVVRCNAATPVYRWFLAANLQLEQRGELGRVMPFPIDQPADEEHAEKGAEPQSQMTTFQFMRCTQQEHAEYRKLLDFAVLSEGLERGFNTAARFSYEVLHKRGVTELSSAEVDRVITRVMLMNPSRLDCLLFAGTQEDRSADAELLTRHSVLRC